MKKLLCLLLALLMALPCAAALAEEEEEAMALYLYERRMVTTEEGCVLHLRLKKEGGIAYCLDEPDVVLLDAQGDEIIPLAQRMEAPLNPVPEGDCFFPVTMYYTLPEGVQAADFRVQSLPGEAFSEPSAEPVSTRAGHILSAGTDGPSITAWLRLPDDQMSVSGYMIVFYIYGPEEEYLGSLALSWEDADLQGTGSEVQERLGEVLGLPPEALEYYNVQLDDAAEYYLFEAVPLPGLAEEDIPASASFSAYRCKSPLRVMASSFEQQEDGSWRVWALLQNGACEPVRVDGMELSLADKLGSVGKHKDADIESGLWELDAFGFTTAQFTFSGLPKDFIPAQLLVQCRIVHEEAAYNVGRLGEDCCALSSEDGGYVLTVTVPWERFLKEDGTESRYAGVLWYARDPQDYSLFSCGLLDARNIRAIHIGKQHVYQPFEIPNVPEGVTPEILLFFFSEK